MCIATHCHVYRHIRFGTNFSTQFGISSITPKILQSNSLNEKTYQAFFFFPQNFHKTLLKSFQHPILTKISIYLWKYF